MNFINILLVHSQVKEARLYNAAKKAAANPETGITITNKAAYHVIKDCAIMTVKYLPHYVFAHYANPFTELYGKFNRTDIEQFVKGAETDYTLAQLLSLILDKIQNLPSAFETKPDSKINFEVAASDPYGDYGISTDLPLPSRVVESPLDVLCRAFGAK